MTFSLAYTHGSYCCHYTWKEWPNTHAHTYEDAHTKNKTKQKCRKNKTSEIGGRKKKRKEGGEKRRGKKEEKERERGKKKKKQGGGWV